MISAAAVSALNKRESCCSCLVYTQCVLTCTIVDLSGTQGTLGRLGTVLLYKFPNLNDSHHEETTNITNMTSHYYVVHLLLTDYYYSLQDSVSQNSNINHTPPLMVRPASILTQTDCDNLVRHTYQYQMCIFVDLGVECHRRFDHYLVDGVGRS